MSGRPDPQPAEKPWELHEHITRENERIAAEQRDAARNGATR
ncbi:hypothetical protein VSH64_34430 [Amycolatopsis rhabdoformis]|uniref:Uncharacterized protein n=1 Tax=Amycolatopsis rhabdoformis TaxID=1448059 RepID=A0ABZ1I0J9_9PSEU|nr:hypothetical protein [Amycolatopsis rhabdoformis]WSE27916.1 hypothetical protein VSH64_34430 [Amycolatopsis rhabdoformis]